MTLFFLTLWLMQELRCLMSQNDLWLCRRYLVVLYSPEISCLFEIEKAGMDLWFESEGSGWCVCVCMGRLPSFCSRMKQEHPTGQVTYEQCLIIICHFLTLVVTFSKDFNCRPYPLLLSPLSLDRCSPLQSLFPSALVCTAVLRSTLATIATDCPFSGGFCCLPLPPDLVPAFSRAEVR